MAKPGTIGPANPNAQPSPTWLKRAERNWSWEATLLGQLGGAAGIGGGVFCFHFRTGRLTETFMFIGGGPGLGGSVGGSSLPDFGTKKLSYSPLTVRRAFSVYDLDGAAGFLGGGNASMAAGYSVVSISAFDTSGMLFDPSDCSGLSAGVGAQLFGFCGMWRSVATAAAALNEKLRTSL